MTWQCGSWKVQSGKRRPLSGIGNTALTRSSEQMNRFPDFREAVFDHIVDHIWRWSTWKQWAQEFRKVSQTKQKVLKTAKKCYKNLSGFIWDQEARSSSLRTSTKKRPFLRLKTLENGRFFIILHNFLLCRKFWPQFDQYRTGQKIDFSMLIDAFSLFSFETCQIKFFW